MSRVKIKFPEKSYFTTKIEVLIEHINYGNHVGNDKYLSFCHEARLRYLKSINQNELDFFKTSLIMADAELSYKSQAYHGDVLSIELSFIEISPKSFEIYYRMNNQKKETVLLAKTGMVYFDYEKKKMSEAPREWLELISLI